MLAILGSKNLYKRREFCRKKDSIFPFKGKMAKDT